MYKRAALLALGILGIVGILWTRITDFLSPRPNSVNNFGIWYQAPRKRRFKPVKRHVNDLRKVKEILNSSTALFT